MKTIILAAGVGQRLGEAADNRPKCLLEFGSRSLLLRHLDILAHYEVGDIILVTGYQAGLLGEALQSTSEGRKVRMVHNSDYTSGSLISMLCGLQAVEQNEDVLLMDADVLYDHRIIGRLLDSQFADCFLLDRDFVPGDEPVKLCVLDGRLVEFRKKIDDNLRFDQQGESVGFFRFSAETVSQLIQGAEDYLSRGQDQQPYEECIRDLLLATPDRFGYEDISGLKWIEIDFPEDVQRAETDILPRIAQVT